MLRKWLLCGVIAAAGAVTWNEYRLWTHRGTPAPMQAAPPAQLLVTAAKPVGEEECDAVIIDLSDLQRQTNEPTIADTEEPATTGQLTFGVGVNSDAGLTGNLARVPAQFQQHSADGDCCAAKGNLAEACKKLTGWIWGTSPRDGSEESEPLNVMPRPAESHYLPDHQHCPYLGGCPYEGSAYRHSAPAGYTAGEEPQDAPPAKPPVDQKRKQPKLDTMEIRPGDVPPGWFRKPF